MHRGINLNEWLLSPVDIAQVVLYSLIGTLLGVVTGLIPGIHVNNVALLALLLYSQGYDPLLLSALLIGNLISHTFLDFIPSTFLGAPEEGTALSVLPMHRMLLEGRGYRAVHLSAIGSLLAMIYSFPLIFLLQIFLTVVGYEGMRPFIPVILFAIVLYMLYLESLKGIRNMLTAAYIFMLAGTLGIIVLNLPQNGNYVPVNIGSGLLFPVFTGLFGIPTLILSRNANVPPQIVERVRIVKNHFYSAFYGTLSGSLVGFLPGVTSGIATVIAKGLQRNDDTESYIVSLGSVNTANSIFNLAALFIIFHPRSRAIGVISSMVPVIPWVSTLYPPRLFILLLISAYIASVVAFFLTLLFGRIFAKMVDILGKNYGKLSLGILIFLAVMIFIFTGPLGLLVAAIATLIGLLPPKMGVMRVHLMGVIILPVLLFYLT